MAPHSSTLAWKIPWTEEPGRLQSMQSLRADTTERLHFHFSLCCIREGNGNPLQCSCLENPRDGGAWWAAVYGVTQSRTRLKRLSSSSSKQNLEVSWVICKKERAAWQKEEQTVYTWCYSSKNFRWISFHWSIFCFQFENVTWGISFRILDKEEPEG